MVRKQRLALAHIDAETDLGTTLRRSQWRAGTVFHRKPCRNCTARCLAACPEWDLVTPENEPIVPGQLRQRDDGGATCTPDHKSVPAFLDRWANFYGGVRRGEAALVASGRSTPTSGLGASLRRRQRAHPRLHTHTLLSALGYTGGLWSPLRGFARNTERYYALLADADSLRRGDLDGRGNLSEQALMAWIDYVLDTCLDQVGFMAGMLDFETMKSRIEACLVLKPRC